MQHSQILQIHPRTPFECPRNAVIPGKVKRCECRETGVKIKRENKKVLVNKTYEQNRQIRGIPEFRVHHPPEYFGQPIY